jgi:hypothetical protein
VLGRIDADQAPTRIALHRNATDPGWDGCEIVNVFAFTGLVPPEVVQAETACSLQGVGADNVSTELLFVPPGLNAIAAVATGEFSMGGKRVWARYSAFLAQEPPSPVARGDQPGRRGMLVEHNTFVTGESLPRLQRELLQTGDAFYQAIIAALTER